MDQHSELRGKAEFPPRTLHPPPASSSSGSTPSPSKRKYHDIDTNSPVRPRVFDPDADADAAGPAQDSASTPTRSPRRSTPPAAAMAANEHLSTHKSDSGLHIVLHPLPLLEISDFITRGYQRDFKGAIVGALLGQQNGREITIEYSFTLKSNKTEDGTYQLDELFFSSRLEQSAYPPIRPLCEPPN